MKIDTYVFPHQETYPIYLGYIEKEVFDEEECFELCNWREWADEMPKQIHPIGEADDFDKYFIGHGVCFVDPETQEHWLALSVGWFIGDMQKVADYVKRHKGELHWPIERE